MEGCLYSGHVHQRGTSHCCPHENGDKRNAPPAGSCSTRPARRTDRSPPPTPASLRETPSLLASAGMRPSLALDPTRRFPLVCARSVGGTGQRGEILHKLRVRSSAVHEQRRDVNEPRSMGAWGGVHPRKHMYVVVKQSCSRYLIFLSSLKPPTPTSSESYRSLS